MNACPTFRPVIPPAHAHEFLAMTTESLGHAHQIQGFTFPTNGTAADRHRHYYQGYTRLEKNHVHRFYGITGPAVPLPDGTHYHVLSGTVYRNYLRPIGYQQAGEVYLGGVQYSPTPRETHNHRYSGRAGQPIGQEPPGW